MSNVLLIVNYQLQTAESTNFLMIICQFYYLQKFIYVLISHHYFCPGKTQFSLIITNKINNRIQNIHTLFI